MAIKKVSITILIGVLLLIIIFSFYGYIPNKTVVLNKNNDTLVNSNTLTMMYETGPDTGEYQVSSDTSWPQEGYIFNERLSKCENGSTLTWDDENKKVLLQANVSDKCYVYFDKEKLTLANYIINEVYTEDGVNDLYYHDGVGTYTNADKEAGDNSYRYAGANPNNYVCFGSDEETCPTDNLYRIIGVFNGQVKLIKYDYANSDLLGTNGDYYGDTEIFGSYYKGSKSVIDEYYWNRNGSNTWSESQLNTVNLNTNYLNNIENKWSNLIATTEWQVGGNATGNIYGVPVKQTYQNEIISPVSNTIYSAKIGLMYVSDYGYAASPNNWNINLSSYSSVDSWIYMGIGEWTITRRSDGTNYVFYIYNAGRVDVYNVYNRYGIRPSFYLNTNVTLAGGTGTQSDPYRIE